MFPLNLWNKDLSSERHHVWKDRIMWHPYARSKDVFYCYGAKKCKTLSWNLLMKVFWGTKKSHEFFLRTIRLASSTKYVRTVSQWRWKTSSKKATIKKKQNPGEEADKREGGNRKTASCKCSCCAVWHAFTQTHSSSTFLTKRFFLIKSQYISRKPKYTH